MSSSFETTMKKFGYVICQKLSLDFFQEKEMVEQAIQIAIWKAKKEYDPSLGSLNNFGYIKLMGELYKCRAEIRKNHSPSPQDHDIESYNSYHSYHNVEEKEIIEKIKERISPLDWELIERVLTGEITRTVAGKIRGFSVEYITQIIKKCQKMAKKLS